MMPGTVCNKMFSTYYTVGRWVLDENTGKYWWWQPSQQYTTREKAQDLRDTLVSLALTDEDVDLVDSPYYVVRIDRWEEVVIMEDD